MGLTRAEFLLRGLKVPFGSLEEAIASAALSRKHQIHFMTILSIVNAIIQLGNVIAAVLTGNAPSDSGGVTKSMDALKELLFPQEAEIKETKAQRALRILQKELEGGPYRVVPKSVPRKRKGRIVRKGV